jgi:light-regulated signal transduction histidine kinase (bacteriophytochrome)
LARPILDEDGKLVRLIGVCQDITDRKLAEEELRRLNLELERRVAERTHLLEKSLSDLEAFNAMVSHDLRAPLTVIHLCTEVVERQLPGSLTASTGEALGRIRRAVSHMTSLVDDLLALARVGHVALQRAEVDLAAVAKDVVGELAAVHADQAVEIAIEPSIPCAGDARLMRVMMQNLLGNAWKFTSRVERPRVEVGTTDVEGRRAVYVRDNGAGFDMSEAHRLFAPFERLHEAAEFPGTGVGLAAVQRIVERHGGRVWAESEPGRGATFYLDLSER